MTTQTKPCLACCQAINAAATKCPHCHQVQTALAGWQNKPAAHLVAFLAVIAIFAAILYSFYGDITKPLATSSLEVGAARVQIGKPDERWRANCFASIKNTDKHAWGNLSLQAEFFDAKGDRVDVQYQEHRVSIYPSRSMEARVSGQANAEVANYAACKISVLNAS